MNRKVILCILFSISMVVTLAQRKHHKIPLTEQQKNEAKALARIDSLYDVKDFIKSAKTSMPIVVIDGDPDSTWNYYRVNVGIGNFDMARTIYHFFVAPRTFEVHIWDEMDNSGEVPIHLVSLRQWRKWRHDPRFNGFHTIKNNRLIVLNRDGKPIQRHTNHHKKKQP